MKKLFFILPLLISFTYGQPGGRQGRTETRGFFDKPEPTVQILPSAQTKIRVFYLYRIPYDILVFERKNGVFRSDVRILAEVLQDKNFITRDFKDVTLTVDDFDKTESKTDFLQGFITFELSPGHYNLRGLITDLNSEREIRIHPVEIHGIADFEKGIYKPIVISANNVCNGKTLPQIVNHGGGIPYSSKDYQIVIPLADTTVKSITVELRNNDNEPVTRTVTEAYNTQIGISSCDNNLYIDKNNDVQVTRNFVIRNFSKKLNEGHLLLTIKKENSDEEIDFPLAVKWLNKPFSLHNPEFAIEMLRYIDSDSTVSALLDADEEEYPEELHNYWKKFDPSPETSYNELMTEFYERVDYAALEFRGITRKNGLRTDRGKIYIKYGKPDKVDRYSNSNGYMVETWIYSKPEKKFIFVDKRGTGNFVLVEG